ncbi:MAG: hypothetical protein EOR67_16140 [Mesorhizobium sp.]|uniref:hypothetical protein n=1 Tax=Mesorhizobium sp. TaxID=1871066 RepID=UPI000FE45D81|nr:hypothetical protein [Mesorhizobium sp.]RWL87727.1 MAG: hypothetical protein EOR67_16140 [Mesorhizobium sp.]
MPIILDQFGHPVTISPQREFVSAETWQEAEETIAPAEHQRARAAARSEGYFEGVAEGKKAGVAAVGKHFMDIVRGCHGNDAKLLAALDLALEFPEITAAGCVDMAGRHFAGRRGSASLALRDNYPDSLAVANAQLAEEQKLAAQKQGA